MTARISDFGTTWEFQIYTMDVDGLREWALDAYEIDFYISLFLEDGIITVEQRNEIRDTLTDAGLLDGTDYFPVSGELVEPPALDEFVFPAEWMIGLPVYDSAPEFWTDEQHEPTPEPVEPSEPQTGVAAILGVDPYTDTLFLGL